MRLSRVLRDIFVLGVIAFLLVPVAFIVALSFNDGEFFYFPLERMSFRWYVAVAENDVVGAVVVEVADAGPCLGADEVLELEAEAHIEDLSFEVCAVERLGDAPPVGEDEVEVLDIGAVVAVDVAETGDGT